MSKNGAFEEFVLEGCIEVPDAPSCPECKTTVLQDRRETYWAHFICPKCRNFVRRAIHTLVQAPPDAPITPWPKSPGVYVVQLNEAVVKIGVASNIRQRMNSFQGSAVHRVNLLAWMPGTKKEEASLHSRFASDWLNVSGTRELFGLSSQIRTFIDQMRTSLGLDAWNPQAPELPQRWRQRTSEPVLTPEMKARLDGLAYDQQLTARRLLDTRMFLSKYRYDLRKHIEEWLRDPKTTEPFDFRQLTIVLQSLRPMIRTGRKPPFVPIEWAWRFE